MNKHFVRLIKGFGAIAVFTAAITCVDIFPHAVKIAAGCVACAVLLTGIAYIFGLMMEMP